MLLIKKKSKKEAGRNKCKDVPIEKVNEANQEIARIDIVLMRMVDCTGTVTAFFLCDEEHKWHKAVLIATLS